MPGFQCTMYLFLGDLLDNTFLNTQFVSCNRYSKGENCILHFSMVFLCFSFLVSSFFLPFFDDFYGILTRALIIIIISIIIVNIVFIGNEKGIINYRFSRTQLNPCVANCKIKVDDNKRISLSEAFGLETDVPINLCEEKCYSSNCPCLENKNISNYNCLCFNSYLPSSNN